MYSQAQAGSLPRLFCRAFDVSRHICQFFGSHPQETGMIFVVRENLRGLRLAHSTAIPRRIRERSQHASFRRRSLDGTARTIAGSRFERTTAGPKVTSHPVHLTGAVSARGDHDAGLRAVSRRRWRARPSRRTLAESRAGAPRVRDPCACGEEGRRTTKEELARDG